MPGINIGIDLGTSNVRFFVEGKGVVLQESAVTAREVQSGRTVSVGSGAYKMIGRLPDSLSVQYPLRESIISDFTAAQNLLRFYLQKLCGNRIFKPNLILCCPTRLTGLEKRSLLNIARLSGAAKACLLDTPLAAAFGAGVDPHNACGTMVVDIGGGTTEIAVVTKGCLAGSESLPIAGLTFDDDIRRYVRRERNIMIGRLTAEQVKHQIGSAYLRNDEIGISVKGKSYLNGMPVVFEMTTTEVFLAMREHLEQIAAAVHGMLSQMSPELLADIADSGIVLSGGSALLPGMAQFFERKTGVAARVADDPQTCVARGIGSVLEHMDILNSGGYLFQATPSQNRIND